MAKQENKNTMDINLQLLSPLLRRLTKVSDLTQMTVQLHFYDKKCITFNYALNYLLLM